METNWGPEFVTDPTAETEVPVDEAQDEDEDLAAPPLPQQRQKTRQSEPDRASLANALRELEAAKARVERDAKKAQDEMRQKLVLELLPALDNLDRTIAAAVQHRDAPAVVEGVELVRRQILGVLEGFGVRRIETRGQHFDPTQHEAISIAPVKDPRHDRIVIEQIEPGYAMGDKLVRAARVVVGRAQRYH